MASAGPKCVAFIDMDCCYVAVERARDASLRGVPCAVVQYNPYERGGVRTVGADEDRRTASNGSIIAVSYEARARGVTRQMRANEARKQCPELVAVQVRMCRALFDPAEWDAEAQEFVGGKCMTPFADEDIRELVDAEKYEKMVRLREENEVSTH